jgi:trans-aconitate 2-methyltransferase
MIKLAKSIFLNRQYTNLTFELMDARKIAFESQFDIAFSNAALHWIVDQKAILLGVQRSLKTQGRILFQMAGKGNAQAILNILDDLLAMPQWESYFDDFTFPYAFLSPEMYRLMLLEAGLTPLRVELLPKEMKFAGAEGLEGWVRTTWLPFTERLPVERRDSFVGEIVNRYLEFHPVDATGVVHLDMIRLEAEAQKV